MREREQMAVNLYEPIPLELPSVDGWKDVPIHGSQELLVPLGPFSNHADIFTSAVYFGEHSNSPYMQPPNKLDGVLVTMFVREGVARRLEQAERLLPAGHHVMVLDSYRPLGVQQSLYDHYFDALQVAHPDWSAEDVATETQKYVSVPSNDPAKPSPHNTGGSTDVAIFYLEPEHEAQLQEMGERIANLQGIAPQNFTDSDEAHDPVLRELYLLEMQRIALIRQRARFLDFGTPFDHGEHEAAANYFERLEQERPLAAGEVAARDNRRLLHNVMKTVGMAALPSEWWHFNAPESQMGARALGLDHAEYGGMWLPFANKEHERMRRMHWQGLVRMQEAALQGGRYFGADETLSALIHLNEAALRRTGDPRLTHLARAAIIEPSQANVA